MLRAAQRCSQRATVYLDHHAVGGPFQRLATRGELVNPRQHILTPTTAITACLEALICGQVYTDALRADALRCVKLPRHELQSLHIL